MSIQIDGERVDIYNTHLDAGKSKKDIRVRKEQLHSLKNYIELNSSPYPIIIAGDINFNLSDHSSKAIINGFMSDLNLEMVDWSIDSLNQVVVDDYLFYRESDTMGILLISGGVDQKLSGLSDHSPIGAIFDIRKK
jgi:endonuclease/exonuclease/phosphatase (EEP) superfamily protein YafD